MCVGPPDSEDRFNLLYRMLDNLGLDTAKVEDIVDNSNVVKKHRDEEEDRIRNDPAKVAEIQKKKNNKEEEDDSIFLDQLLKKEADESPDVQKSKIGIYVLASLLLD